LFWLDFDSAEVTASLRTVENGTIGW